MFIGTESSLQQTWPEIKCLFEKMKSECPVFGILVIGETGAGKSTLINNFVGEDIAKVTDSFESETAQISKHTMLVEGVAVALYDTPGLSDSRCDCDDKNLQEMERILKTDEIKLVIYCWKLTETKMRRSLICTFDEYSKVGVKWEHIIIALTFADCMPVPNKEKKKEGFEMARFFDDRVAKLQAQITEMLIEKVGQACADHILCKPSTSDPDELLPNGERWFAPLWLDILQILSPPATIRLLEMNANKMETCPGKDGGDSTELHKAKTHSSVTCDAHASPTIPSTAAWQRARGKEPRPEQSMFASSWAEQNKFAPSSPEQSTFLTYSSPSGHFHTSFGNPSSATPRSHPERVVSLPSRADQRAFVDDRFGVSSDEFPHIAIYNISRPVQNVHLHSTTPAESNTIQAQKLVRKLRLTPNDQLRMLQIVDQKVASYAASEAVIGVFTGAGIGAVTGAGIGAVTGGIIGLVGGPIGVALGASTGAVVGGSTGAAFGSGIGGIIGSF